ncbi:MAG: hypothetical protein E6I17_00025 [Chloroflexi bacterium]|nr:MAG: hypothetical protein E6I17_00025 [Chloroflexota bacterium]
MSRHDIIFAGAGHNNLVAAAYAARAGFRVLVLEGAPRIGGDTGTEELTLPGFPPSWRGSPRRMQRLTGSCSPSGTSWRRW